MDERAFITDVLHEAAMQISDAFPAEDSREKSAREVVTETDMQVEQFIRQKIMEQYPQDGIRGEELGDWQPEATRQWVIDPVDGTTNFAHAIPLFCCAIALLEEERVIAAGVSAPLTGTTYTAARGQGAYKNGARIHTPEQELAKGMVGFCHSSDEDGITTVSAMYAHAKKQTRDFRKFGSANLEICMAEARRNGAQLPATALVDQFYAQVQNRGVRGISDQAVGLPGGLPGRARSRRERHGMDEGRVGGSGRAQRARRAPGQPPSPTGAYPSK